VARGGDASWGNHNNDGKLDLLLQNVYDFLGSVTIILQHDGNDQFSEALPTGTLLGALDIGDYDNDSDLDVLLGSIGSYKMFRNDNGKLVNIRASLPVRQFYLSCVLGDYDNDGDLDIALAGQQRYQILRNNNGIFSNTGIVLSETRFSNEAAWTDYDQDGDLDIFLAGDERSWLFRNDNGNFVDSGIIFPSLLGGSLGSENSISWGDIDNDGDLDLVLAADNAVNSTSLMVFKNENGTFRNTDVQIPESSNALSVALGDYDSTGYLDILATELLTQVINKSTIYRNNVGTFEDIDANLPATNLGEGVWGDLDNDGDLDVAISDVSTLKVSRNDGSAFTEIAVLTGSALGRLKWAEFDNDGDLDIIMTGTNGALSGSSNFKVYRNNSTRINAVPSPPVTLNPEVKGNSAILHWNTATDSETPSPGLTYNMRISTQPGGINVKSPMADLNTGYRRVVELGNTNHVTSYHIKDLEPGRTYYWGVQAIDNAFAGSPFVNGQSFVAGDPRASIKVMAPAQVGCGQEFLVKVIVGDPTPISNLFGLSFDLLYQTQYLNYVSAQITDPEGRVQNLLGNDLLFLPTPNDPAGKVSIAVSRTAPQPGVNGSGPVVWIKFTAEQDITEPVQVNWILANITANDPNGNPIDFDDPQNAFTNIICGCIV